MNGSARARSRSPRVRRLCIRGRSRIGDQCGLTDAEQSRDDEIPQLVRAVVAISSSRTSPVLRRQRPHGRFLLAVELSRSLTPVAWLSLSATIADDKDRYYRAFADVENPLNRGDVTLSWWRCWRSSRRRRADWNLIW